jgi:hypothetical protein
VPEDRGAVIISVVTQHDPEPASAQQPQGAQPSQQQQQQPQLNGPSGNEDEGTQDKP